jgi:HEAT repeat protein
VSDDPRALARELDLPDPESRRIATQQIARVRSPLATALLVRALGDEDWRVRKEGAKIASGVEPRDDVVTALVAALSEKENIGLRNAAVEALIDIGTDSVVPATRALEELDSDGRKLAVEILGGIPDVRGTHSLANALSDPDPNVRVAAAEALGSAAVAGEAARKHAVLALTQALSSEETLVKLAALEALERLQAKVPWKTFEPFADDPVLRRYAIAAAGRSQEEAALLALANAVSDTSLAVARDAVVALVDFVIEEPQSERFTDLARARILASPLAQERVRTFGREGETKVKGAALVVLGLLRMRSDVPTLVRALEDEETAPRAELALRLFGTDAIQPLLEAGRTSIAPVRAATLSLVPLLSDALSPFALDALREATLDTNSEIAAAAITAMASVGGAEDLVALAPHATSSDPRIAGTACSALETLAGRHVVGARALLSKINATGRSAVVGCVLIGAMAGHGSAGSAAEPTDIAFLRAALDHDDVRVRRAAVDALASIGDPSAGDAVAFALADEEEDVVLAAIRALGRMGRVEPLLMLLRTTKDAGLVASALLALSDASPDDAVRTARPLVLLSDPILACAAVEAIGQLREARRNDGLFLAIEHPEPEVVKAALVEISRHADERALDKIGQCLDHDSLEVRRLAARLLGADGSAFAHARLRAGLDRESDPLVRDAMTDALSNGVAAALSIRAPRGHDGT